MRIHTWRAPLRDACMRACAAKDAGNLHVAGGLGVVRVDRRAGSRDIPCWERSRG